MSYGIDKLLAILKKKNYGLFKSGAVLQGSALVRFGMNPFVFAICMKPSVLGRIFYE